MAAALFYGLLHAFKLKILMETGNTAIFTALLLFKMHLFSGFEEEGCVFFIYFSFLVANETVLLSILGWEGLWSLQFSAYMVALTEQAMHKL
jgi:hypothetical protein